MVTKRITVEYRNEIKPTHGIIMEVKFTVHLFVEDFGWSEDLGGTLR